VKKENRFLFYLTGLRKRLLAPAVLRNGSVCAALLIAAALSWSRFFEPYELLAYDWRMALRPARPVSDRIAIIEIGDDSLQKIGSWPFDRGWHAEPGRSISTFSSSNRP
jgi:CHASE2 domain-containing sensor protein